MEKVSIAVLDYSTLSVDIYRNVELEDDNDEAIRDYLSSMSYDLDMVNYMVSDNEIEVFNVN